LLDGGTTTDKVPYLVMELVEGQPIDQYCKANELSVSSRLRLFLAVCEAVSYAHRHLVVHRDLKPNNIFITADGAVKLLDFGVAKVLDSVAPATKATVTLLRAFTLTFASPEQIRGEPVTTATDVYSLGVLLYHLLTGASPYRCANGPLSALSREICEQSPSPPSATAAARGAGVHHRATRINADLDSISMLALQKEPARRYSSVDLLAEDVRRYLEDRPVLARGNAVPARVAKFVRRHWFATAACIAAALAFAATVVLTAHNERALGVQSAQRFAAAHRTARFLLRQLEERTGAAGAEVGSSEEEQVLERLESIAARTQDEQTLRRGLESTIPAQAPVTPPAR
jgi:hypothetical protein